MNLLILLVIFINSIIYLNAGGGGNDAAYVSVDGKVECCEFNSPTCCCLAKKKAEGNSDNIEDKLVWRMRYKCPFLDNCSSGGWRRSQDDIDAKCSYYGCPRKHKNFEYNLGYQC